MYSAVARQSALSREDRGLLRSIHRLQSLGLELHQATVCMKIVYQHSLRLDEEESILGSAHGIALERTSVPAEPLPVTQQLTEDYQKPATLGHVWWLTPITLTP